METGGAGGCLEPFLLDASRQAMQQAAEPGGELASARLDHSMTVACQAAKPSCSKAGTAGARSGEAEPEPR